MRHTGCREQCPTARGSSPPAPQAAAALQECRRPMSYWIIPVSCPAATSTQRQATYSAAKNTSKQTAGVTAGPYHFVSSQAATRHRPTARIMIPSLSWVKYKACFPVIRCAPFAHDPAGTTVCTAECIFVQHNANLVTYKNTDSKALM